MTHDEVYKIMRKMEWYAEKSSRGQAAISDEAGRTVALVYDVNDAVLLCSAPNLLAELNQTRLTLMYAAQEAKGKVKKEIIDSWLYQAYKAERLIYEASMDIEFEVNQ